MKQEEMAGYQSLVRSVYVKTGMPPGQDNKPTKVDFQIEPGTGETRIGDKHTPGTVEPMMDRTARHWLNTIGGACLAWGIVGGLLTLLGAYFAFRTERLPLVAIGTMTGILSFGFALGAALAFIALILLLLCTDEFDRVKKEKAAGRG